MTTYTPARLYATVVGAVLVIAGILGFFYNAKFSSDPAVRDDVLGILSVNGWHNVVHLVTGLLGLLLARSAAREYSLGLGVVYLVVAIWGFAIGSGESILSIIPVNTADNVLHLALGLAGLGAGLATPRPAGVRGDPAAATR
jgi:hypothetical protein